jgi:peptidoglycan/LPS O-acetylase OafA/YrhL
MLSGLFVPGSADRKGGARFTRDRLIRLGVPILAYYAVIRPLCLIPAALHLYDTPLSAARFLAFGGDPGVTWFLEVLLVLTLGYVLLHRRIVMTPALPVVFGPGLVLAFTGTLAVVTWVWQWCTPPGAYWPIVGLPSPSFLPQYALFFIAGLAAARSGWLDRISRSWALPAALALLVGTALYGPVVGSPVDVHHLGNDALSAVGQALFAVGAAVLLVLIFRTLLARPAGRITRFLADQSFVVYLIHPVVLVGVAVALSPVHGPALVKAALLFAIAAPLSWGIGRLLRQSHTVHKVT